MSTLSVWTRRILFFVIVPFAIVIAGEFLIQYNWLGRTHWSPFERMWINLTFISVATIYVVVAAIFAARWLWKLSALPATFVLILAGWCIGIVIVTIFRALFTNPAICWGANQQLVFFIGLSALAAYYALRILRPPGAWYYTRPR